MRVQTETWKNLFFFFFILHICRCFDVVIFCAINQCEHSNTDFEFRSQKNEVLIHYSPAICLIVTGF